MHLCAAWSTRAEEADLGGGGFSTYSISSRSLSGQFSLPLLSLQSHCPFDCTTCWDPAPLSLSLSGCLLPSDLSIRNDSALQHGRKQWADGEPWWRFIFHVNRSVDADERWREEGRTGGKVGGWGWIPLPHHLAERSRAPTGVTEFMRHPLNSSFPYILTQRSKDARGR